MQNRYLSSELFTEFMTKNLFPSELAWIISIQLGFIQTGKTWLVELLFKHFYIFHNQPLIPKSNPWTTLQIPFKSIGFPFVLRNYTVLSFVRDKHQNHFVTTSVTFERPLWFSFGIQRIEVQPENEASIITMKVVHRIDLMRLITYCCCGRDHSPNANANIFLNHSF